MTQAPRKQNTKLPPTRTVGFPSGQLEPLLQRIGRGTAGQPARALEASGIPPAGRVEDQMNAAVGCKTDEVALTLLGQVVDLGHPNSSTESQEQLNARLVKATALMAELEPTNATEALLAAQMIGAHGAAMTFMRRATATTVTEGVADLNTLRAVRLMRLFTEQAEAMAKLKGKGGQQRVTVEHVTVSAGGQAIVGAVMPGGRGDRDDNRR